MLEGKWAGFQIELMDPRIALIRFNEPEALNGFTHAMKRDLIEAFTQIQMDHESRVVVVTGEGRGFCAGDDITGRGRWERHANIARTPQIGRAPSGSMGSYSSLRTISQVLNRTVRGLDKLTIAAINGVTIQSGLSFALACDFRIAARTARLGSATLRFGYQPDEGGHYLLVQHIGVAKTLDFLMRKRIVEAPEALELGLVHEVVEPDALMDRALELATEFAEGPQAAMRLLKRSIYLAAETTFAQACDDIATKTAISDHHPDAREGVTAFREKRQPKFS